MILSHCSHDTVLYVAKNMRAADAQEIYGLRWEANPFHIVNDTMAHKDFAWVGWVDEKPCAVFGGAPMRPGVWSMFMFATDDFPKLGLGLTRFALKTCIPTLFGDLGAHRLQCESHEAHTDAHRWLNALGAVREGTKKAYGRDGADYHEYVLLKSTKSTS